MPNLNLNGSEQAILQDVLRMIVVTAPSYSLGRGFASGAIISTPDGRISEAVLTYPDGRKFAVQVDVRQINTNAGRVT